MELRQGGSRTGAMLRGGVTIRMGRRRECLREQTTSKFEPARLLAALREFYCNLKVFVHAFVGSIAGPPCHCSPTSGIDLR